MTSRQRSETPDPDAAVTAELHDPEERASRPRPEGMRRAPRATLPMLVAAVTAAGILGLGLADGGFEPAVWAQATVIVWWTAIVALLAGAWPPSTIPGAAALTAACLFGLAALSAASLIWATDLGAAYEDAVRAAGYLGVFVLVAIAARAGHARAVLAGVAAGLVAIGVVALLSRLEPGFVQSVDEARGLEVSGGRLSHPIGYWNGLGICMATAIPLLIWLAASARRRLLRALAVAATPICVLTLFFSGSRGAGLAAAVAVFVLIAAGPRRVTLAGIAAPTLFAGLLLGAWGSRSSELLNGAQGSAAAEAGDELLVITIVATIVIALLAWFADRWVLRLRLPVVGVRRAALLGAVVILLGVIVADPVTRLRSLDEGPATATVSAENPRFSDVGGSGRVQFWEAALDAAADEPLRGIGAGGFEAYWARNGSLDFTVAHAHSFYLESAAELGIGAAALAIAAFLVPAIAGIRRRLGPTSWAVPEAAEGTIGAALAVLAGLAAAVALEWIWDLPVAFVPAMVAAACLCVPRARPQPRGRVRSLGAFAVVAAAGLASIAGAGALFLEQAAIERSREAVAEQRLADAASEARAASDVLPFDAEPYAQLALVERRRDDTRAARTAIERAQDRATGDWALPFIEAGIAFQAGELGRGIWALNHAQALNPRADAPLFAAPSALPPGPYAKRIVNVTAGEDDEATE